MRIEYQNVDIAQEEHVILKGVNFQAEAGEFVYLIGKVGTGKSSLLKTFYGELDVHTGSARVLDREMTKIKRRHIPALRKRLGIVFQDFQLLNDRTVRANLDNPEGILKSGLYVSITLPYGEQKQAILVNSASIGTDQLGKYLYVVNDSNIVRYRHITIGQLIGDSLRQVTDGLSPQERYVTKALMKVRDGMKIHPVD